jgi:hypothetical protein
MIDELMPATVGKYNISTKPFAISTKKLTMPTQKLKKIALAGSKGNLIVFTQEI